MSAQSKAAYVELYLNEPKTPIASHYSGRARAYIRGHLCDGGLAKPPWITRYLQGHIDAPLINLTPGTRSGIIHDQTYGALLDALRPLEVKLNEIIDSQRMAEEEKASHELLLTIQRAFREAFLALPEEYDWFDIHSRAHRSTTVGGRVALGDNEVDVGVTEPERANGRQRQFFEFSGSLYSVVISPASSVVRVNEMRSLRALPYDRARRRVEESLAFRWEVVEGAGHLVIGSRIKRLTYGSGRTGSGTSE
jgi:hypothetical protein